GLSHQGIAQEQQRQDSEDRAQTRHGGGIMLEELGRRVARLSLSDLSAKARERLLLATLANVTVGIAGPKYTVIPEPVGQGPYRLLSGKKAATAESAAFYNGAAMHARTQDDFDPIGKLHIGVIILP